MPSRSLLQHVASFGRFAHERGRREQSDAVTHAQLAATELSLPAGLEIHWLGTAGYRITYPDRSLLIDPYLTRVPLKAVFSRAAVAVDPALHARYLGSGIGQVVGILVGHTHFDHAIDVPLLSQSLAAPVYGSRSLRRLMALHGLAEHCVVVDPGRIYELGPFTVTFHRSRHSKLLLGYKVPFDGELTCEQLDALSPSAYRCGDVYGIRIEVAGTTLYHQGSADLLDDEVPAGGVDLFLAGIAGRSFTERYWERILTRLDPSVVVANHFDDFFVPLSDPMGFSTNVNLTALPDEIAAVSRQIGVATLPAPSADHPVHSGVPR